MSSFRVRNTVWVRVTVRGLVSFRVRVRVTARRSAALELGILFGLG